jgi:hypothetical protein
VVVEGWSGAKFRDEGDLGIGGSLATSLGGMAEDVDVRLLK